MKSGVYYIKRIFIVFIISINGCTLYRSNIPTVYFPSLSNPIVEVSSATLLNNLEKCEEIHPQFANLRNAAFFNPTIENFKRKIPKYDIPTTESVYLQRKLFDYYTNEDPHFRVIPQLYTTEKKINNKNIKVLPFSVVAINDTMIIHKTFNNALKIGDRIVSINQIEAEKFLEYSYRDRYMHTPLLQIQHHFTFSNVYHLTIERENKVRFLIIEGIPLKEYYNKIKNLETTQIFPDYLTALFKIDEFKNNKKTTKKLTLFIDKMKRLGYKNLIIDLRCNPGGDGENIEELMSLISSKSKLLYQKEIKVKLTNSNYEKYMFPKDSVNKTVTLPDKFVINEIEITPTSFAKELNLYVLVSKNTSSMAACFANLIQYNQIGFVAGESLLKNALKYGEVIEIKEGVATFFISTTEYLDYTNAEDGILRPDIKLNYSAKEHLTNEDPVLQGLLNHIRRQQELKLKNGRF